MSLPLLRRARITQTLSAARRSVSRCRTYAAVSPRPRHEQKHEQVPGPSQSSASRATNTTTTTTTEFDGQLESATNVDAESLEPFSRVQSYLASVHAGGIQPTLADLERCRPTHCPPPHSRKYAATYGELIATLDRAFTKEQLRRLLEEALGAGRHSAKKRKKVEYAESILEQLWKWPTLSAIEKAERDKTEVVSKSFPLAANELFLILGRDGTDLLRLSQDYDVHISLKEKPALALRAEGTRAGITELAQHLDTLKQSIITGVFDLPSPVPIPEDMLQRISRLSLAYLENVESSPGKVRVHAKNAQAVETAERLASRTVHEIEQNSCVPLLTYIPPYTDKYALYPYLAPLQLPITMNTSGAFRLRRVCDFFTANFRAAEYLEENNSQPHHDLERYDDLESNEGSILTEDESSVQLKEILSQVYPDGMVPSGTVVKVSPGHILLTRVSNHQRPTLVPPLTGEHPFGKIRRWIANNPVKMTFVPDLPSTWLRYGPSGESMIHRLVYHSLSSSSDTSAPGRSTPPLPHLRKVISLEVALGEPDRQNTTPTSQTAQQMSSDPGEETSSTTSSDGPTPLSGLSSSRCWAGAEAVVNLMLPTRPMDLQFTVCNSVDLSGSQLPAELQKYLEKVNAFLSGSESQPGQPAPPLLIEHAGQQYLLHKNLSVRKSTQSVHRAADSDRLSTRRRATKWKDAPPQVADCESTLDLESNQKSMQCEYLCKDIISEDSWQYFLHACDTLSDVAYRSRDPVRGEDDD